MSKKSKKENKIEKAKAIVKKINNDLIDASFSAIQTTVKTGEKWQKLTSKLIKKAEPLSKQQINMFVDTAENIKGQLENSTERLKGLVGYDPKMIEKAKKMVAKNSLAKKADDVATKIKKEVEENPLVKKAEKMTAKLKKQISETIEDVKEKVEDYTEEAMKGTSKKKKSTKKAVTEKKPVAKKPATKKVVKKEPIVKKTTVTKVVEKKVVTEKASVKKAASKDDLKVIKGIGPKMETVLNAAGIISFENLAKATITSLEKILTNAAMNPKMYDLSTWAAQAKTVK
jgi:predicted flap endonuclease-1-like 5' DNA nuclease